MRDIGKQGQTELRVNPILCDGVGICAHLAPDLIELDRWGFPLFERRALLPREVPQALKAVKGCPMGALLLEGYESGN